MVMINFPYFYSGTLIFFNSLMSGLAWALVSIFGSISKVNLIDIPKYEYDREGGSMFAPLFIFAKCESNIKRHPGISNFTSYIRQCI